MSIIGIGFNCDFYLRTRFKAYLVAFFVRQGIFDAYFPIQMIRTFHGDLRFLWFTWKWGLDDLFDRSRHGSTWFLGHGLL